MYLRNNNLRPSSFVIIYCTNTANSSSQVELLSIKTFHEIVYHVWFCAGWWILMYSDKAECISTVQYQDKRTLLYLTMSAEEKIYIWETECFRTKSLAAELEAHWISSKLWFLDVILITSMLGTNDRRKDRKIHKTESLYACPGSTIIWHVYPINYIKILFFSIAETKFINMKKANWQDCKSTIERCGSTSYHTEQ